MAWKREQIEEVQERIKKAEDWIKVLKALPVRDEFESLSLEETEKRLILMRKEEAVYLSKEVEVLEEAEEVARRPSEAQCLTPSQRQRFTQQQYQQPGLQQQVCIKPFTLSGVVVDRGSAAIRCVQGQSLDHKGLLSDITIALEGLPSQVE
ncbi:hypothetical protein QJQ45_001322 [Haematococcus lacustris]|nr:hypothetical protein QJQ45_001322 [Haematococcus lacustris]